MDFFQASDLKAKPEEGNSLKSRLVSLLTNNNNNENNNNNNKNNNNNDNNR